MRGAPSSVRLRRDRCLRRALVSDKPAGQRHYQRGAERNFSAGEDRSEPTAPPPRHRVRHADVDDTAGLAHDVDALVALGALCD